MADKLQENTRWSRHSAHPAAALRGLPGYSFAPRYIADLPGYEGWRLHHLDEGNGSGPVFLCLHGQPTWSDLYRKMLPVFAKAGSVVAPDLFGFDRSDKPVADGIYTFDVHRGSRAALIEALDLRQMTLVCQDWGGLLGWTLPADFPDRCERLIIMNTRPGTGERSLGDGIEAWTAYNRSQPDIAVGRLIKRGRPILSDEEMVTYDAPFSGARYKAGVRQFPELVPASPDAPGAALPRRARDYLRDASAGHPSRRPAARIRRW